MKGKIKVVQSRIGMRSLFEGEQGNLLIGKLYSVKPLGV